MADAKRDNNRIPTLIAVSNVDNETPVVVKANPSTGGLIVDEVGQVPVRKYYTNAGAVTDGIVWSPASGKRWYITDIFINTSAASTITLEDDLTAGDSTIWKAELAANSGWSHTFETPLKSGEDTADLLITTTAGNVYVLVSGYEI